MLHPYGHLFHIPQPFSNYAIGSFGTTSRHSGNISWKMRGTQFALYLLPVTGPVSLLEFDVGSVPGRR